MAASESSHRRLEAWRLYQKGTPAHVFYCEHTEIFKNTDFEKLRTAVTAIQFSNFVLLIGEIAKLIWKEFCNSEILTLSTNFNFLSFTLCFFI